MPKNPKGTEKIVLIYNEKDICNIWGYQKFLTRHIKAGDKIPARVLRKFFSYFIEEPVLTKQTIGKIITQVKDETLKRFTADKDYVFEKELDCRQDFPKDFSMTEESWYQKEKCNTKGMIEFILSKLPNDVGEIYEDDKKLFNYLFKNTQSYFDRFKHKDTTKFFSNYKRKAVLGYMMLKFGYRLSKELTNFNLEDREPTNEQLKNSVKHRYDSLLKKKKAQK